MSLTDLARPEIVAMKPYSSARSESAAEGILLNANESPWALVDDERARDDEVGPLNRYPEPQHARLVACMEERYGVPAGHLLLTRGSDEGIDLIVRVFCRAGEDAILDTPPSFGMYRIAAQAQGAEIIEIERHPDTLALNQAAMLQVIAGANPPRVAFLTSPANPTGDLVDESFLEDLLSAAAGRCIIVVDEAYAEFSPAPSFSEKLRQFDNLAVLRTLSKAYGAAGLRCGAVLAKPEMISLLRRIIPPYPLATPVVSLALRLFDPESQRQQKIMLSEIAANKLVLLKALKEQPFVLQVWPGEANFVLARVDSAARLLDHCAHCGITIRSFPHAALLKNCVRITVGSRQEIDCLVQALDTYPGNAPESVTELRNG